MSLVAFTFGSLGDIIALLQLADQVRRALCDTRGASLEYRDLIAELDSVVFTISNVQRVLSVHGPRRLAQSVENALYHAIGVCLHLVAQMNARVSTRRQASRDRSVVGAMVADLWQSVGWTVFKREEVLFLRKRLAGQVAAMNTLLTLAQSDQLDHVGDQVSRFHGQYVDESRRQYMLIQEIHRCVTNRSHAMGYTWEAAQNLDNMPIVFTDMLGHTVTLPWEFVRTDQLLHEFLLFYFRNKPFRGLIKSHQYVVVDGDDQFLQDLEGNRYWRTDWTGRGELPGWIPYRPGSRVKMHGAVILKFELGSDRVYTNRNRIFYNFVHHVSAFNIYPLHCLQSLSRAHCRFMGRFGWGICDGRTSHKVSPEELSEDSSLDLVMRLRNSLPHQSRIRKPSRDYVLHMVVSAPHPMGFEGRVTWESIFDRRDHQERSSARIHEGSRLPSLVHNEGGGVEESHK